MIAALGATALTRTDCVIIFIIALLAVIVGRRI